MHLDGRLTMAITSDSPVLKPNEAAEYLKLHVMTVYRLANARLLPAVRIGRSWRISKPALDEFMQRGGSRNLAMSPKEASDGGQ